jgi:hypothetical protein
MTVLIDGSVFFGVLPKVDAERAIGKGSAASDGGSHGAVCQGSGIESATSLNYFVKEASSTAGTEGGGEGMHDDDARYDADGPTQVSSPGNTLPNHHHCDQASSLGNHDAVDSSSSAMSGGPDQERSRGGAGDADADADASAAANTVDGLIHSSVSDYVESNAAVSDYVESNAAVCDHVESVSAVSDYVESNAAVCDFVESVSAVSDYVESNAAVSDYVESNAAVCDYVESVSAVSDYVESNAFTAGDADADGGNNQNTLTADGRLGDVAGDGAVDSPNASASDVKPSSLSSSSSASLLAARPLRPSRGHQSASSSALQSSRLHSNSTSFKHHADSPTLSNKLAVPQAEVDNMFIRTATDPSNECFNPVFHFQRCAKHSV